MTTLRFAVLGAGHGGKTMAAHLALKGFPTILYNRTEEITTTINARGGIELTSYEGGPHGFGILDLVTSNIVETLANSDVIMIVVPSTAHADFATLMAPHLRDDHIVVLNPGRTGGALEFAQVLREKRCPTFPVIAEAETLIYASRSDGPAQARIFRIKESVPIAALPATETPRVLAALNQAYPEFIDGGSVLHTGLNNMGAIFHPTLTILNSGWIESTRGEFQFYIDGVTPSVARILEVMDRERVTVAAALGIRARTAQEWLKMAYGSTGANLYEAIQNQQGYVGIQAPPVLNHRYITEDVPMSLVPIASLGTRYGVSTRGIDSIIRLSCIMHNTDYYRRGRTVEKLGIADLSVSELTQFVLEGSAGPGR